MSDVGKYTPLKTIVGYFLDQYDKSMGDFDKCWILAFRALVNIGFNIMFEPKTLRLQVNGNQTVTLPSDYITWTKIGILNGSSEVSTLRVNRSLTTLKDNNPNRLSYLTPDINDQDFSNFVLNPYYLNYYFGNWYTPLFGLGNGLVQYGECVVDEKNKVIILGPQYPFDDLLLEYISSPQRDDDYQVETVCQEAVIAFIAWKMRLATEVEFYTRLREARRMLKPVRLQDINQAIREQQGFKVKA